MIQDRVWIKGALVGSIWASMELVIGNYFHALKLPFAGQILSGMAVLLLVAISITNREKGIIWRSGLICASLKLLSPGYAILGPMIAILIESLILETIIKLFKKSFVSYMIAGGFAVVWSLIQKILTMFILFGFDFYLLISNLVDLSHNYFLPDNLGIEVIFFSIFIIYFIVGMIWASIGIYIGNKINNINPNEISNINIEFSTEKIKNNGSNSALILRIISHFIMIMAVMIFLKNQLLLPAVTILSFYIALISFYYRGQLKSINNPKFWLQIIIMIMLTTYFISGLSNPIHLFDIDNLIIGLSLFMRAIVILFGFTAISIELKNPAVIAYIKKMKYKVFADSVNLAFHTLPFMIAQYGNNKLFLKSPIKSSILILKNIDNWTNQIESERHKK